MPDKTDQTRIADFLDAETAKIDELIAKQERLIELSQEKRQALISHAVVQGLKPDAPMKYSGISWLGEVPVNWRVQRLRYLCSITTGNKNTEDASDDGKYPFFVRSQEIERSNNYSFDGEGILTAGDGAGVAKVFHYFTGKFAIHQRVYLLHAFKGIQGNFLFHYIKANLYKVVLEGNAKSTVDSLRLPMFKDFVVAYPPSDAEQTRIIEHIAEESRKIDLLIEKARRAIEFLKEHRTVLVSAAVTGKIDVLGAE
ncbi:MAG: restriction endonuclease subunit S [Pyrinomonadaceae bacterium]|nr:restriction endonuclease subunit S [Pyrinomonadaceae bacterium]